MKGILLFFTLLCSILISVESRSVGSNPLHASCRLTWLWPNNNCIEVMDAINSQMNKWHNLTDVACGSSEKCGYKVDSYDKPKKIAGTHTTPKKHYVDDLTMDCTAEGNGASVEGYSTSETWYAVLDSGTNYCNLHNLVTGAGLDKKSGFTETVGSCTQQSSANCDKY